MKLLLCGHCGDVRALPTRSWAVCRCAESRGRYIEGGDAVLEGRHALALGFNMRLFELALSRGAEDRRREISRERGHEFTAFVIPWNAASIQYARTCLCGQEKVSAVPGRDDRPCPCGRYALCVAAAHLHGVFVERDPPELRRGGSKVRRKRAR